jgi:hypothetical protein
MSRLDSNAIDMLKPFALNNNKAAAMAISVLKQNGQSDYKAPVYMPDMDDNRSAQVQWSKAGTPSVEENLMLIFPNPADAFFTVEYSFVSNEQPIVLKISDMNGKVVLTKALQYTRDQLLIDTQNMGKGSYVVSLFAGKKLIKSSTIQIEK